MSMPYSRKSGVEVRVLSHLPVLILILIAIHMLLSRVHVGVVQTRSNPRVLWFTSLSH